MRSFGLAVVAATLLGGAGVAEAETYYVNSAGDDAAANAGCVDATDAGLGGPPCTLRAALTLIRAGNASSHVIRFSIPGPITPVTPLPEVPANTKLGGPGYTTLDGQGAAFPGLVVRGAGTAIGRMQVQGFSDGIVLEAPGHDELDSNWIGIDVNDCSSHPNTGNGIVVKAGSTGNLLSNPATSDPIFANHPYEPYNGNVVGSNGGWGIVLSAGSGPTTLQENTVGATPSYSCPPDYGPDMAPRPNGQGGVLVLSDDNQIGTVDAFDTNPGINYVSGNAGPGVVLGADTARNTVVNNFIGTNGDGTAAVPNVGDGLVALGDDQIIGRANYTSVNIISGNGGNGIVLSGTGSTVVGNVIGLRGDANLALANGQNGIVVDDVGGTVGNHDIRSNVISGNARAGIVLRQSGVALANNTIGTAGETFGADPNALRPNGAAGIEVLRGPATIGDTADQANRIVGNGGAGVLVSSALLGSPPLGVRIQQNEIRDNGGGGISFPGGPAAPTLRAVSADSGKVSFHGSITAAPNTSYDLDLYGQAGCAAPGGAQGRSHVASGVVTTNSDGVGSFGYTGTGSYAAGDGITVTATDASGTTSTFSPCLQTTGGANLAVTQQVVGDAVANDVIDLAITVTNAGPAPATSVTLGVTRPSNTSLFSQPDGCTAPTAQGAFQCTLGTIAAGASRTQRVLLTTPTPGTRTVSAAVRSDQVETDAADNTSTYSFSARQDPSRIATGPGRGTNLDEPSPVFATSVRLDHVQGSVTATLPSGATTMVDTFALVPVGTVVDTSSGIATVTAATPNAGSPTITGQFRDARFRIRQSSAENGLAEARIVSELGCGKASSRAVSKKKRKKGGRRHLWGTAKGRWRIRGKYAAAAVRGTKWRVLDTCTTTEVFVRTGTVVATGLGGARPSRVVLTAGRRQLFTAP